MTTDTDRLLSLARECGHWNGVTVEMNDVGLIAFVERIRKDERERCARIADEQWEAAHLSPDCGVFEDAHFYGYRHASERIAAAIRSGEGGQQP